jgi:hypothetical protein
MRGFETPPREHTEPASILYASSEIAPSGRPELTIAAGATGYRVSYGDGTTFLVDPRGDHVGVHWVPPLDAADAASYLIGPVLGFILRLRGSVPLHASAIAIDGRGILFVGEAWAGKSTTAAAFSMLGYPVLSDDIVRVDEGDAGAIAYPAHPRLNVWSDSAAALYGAADALPAHSETYRKHYLDLVDAGHPFQDAPVPIEIIYLLGERSPELRSHSIAVLPPRAALISLVGHTYGSSFLDCAMRAHEFDLLGRLVQSVPVRELRFGDNLGQLLSSCQALAVNRS